MHRLPVSQSLSRSNVVLELDFQKNNFFRKNQNLSSHFFFDEFVWFSEALENFLVDNFIQKHVERREILMSTRH